MDYSRLVQQQLHALHPHLPMPPADALALSQHLSQHLQAQIRTHGPLPFHRFMHDVLYAPGLGYYSAGLAKLGAEGDFVTAPELSPLFSRTIANALQAGLQGTHKNVLELGAGRGVMAADMLQQWQALNCLPEHYFILEVSADLRAVQAQTLRDRVPALASRVVWLEQWPHAFSGVVVANEVLDAMPHHLFALRQQTVVERAVTLDEHDHFVWTDIAASPTLLAWFNALPPSIRDAFSDGYCSELLLSLPSWINALHTSLDAAHVLLIDYGFGASEFYLPERHDGTLMCHYRHRAHANPLVLVGMQDVTCHVDFSAVANTAFDAGFDIAGYATQAAFLQEAGILSLAQSDDPATHFAYAQQLKRLLLPSEMGELFKVLYLRKNVQETLPGFALNDRRHVL